MVRSTIIDDRTQSRRGGPTTTTLAIAIAIASAFTVGCAGGAVIDGEVDDDDESSTTDADRAGVDEHGDPALADIEALADELAAREAIARVALVECLGVVPARAELDGWAGSGLRGDDLRAAICEGKPATKELRESIDGAFAECLGRAPTDGEVENWIADGFAPADVHPAICDGEESLRRLIEAAYLAWFGRAATPDEVDGWLDTALGRTALLRALAESDGAVRIRLVREAYAVCHGAAPGGEELLAWADKPAADDEVLEAICGLEAAHPLVVAEAFEQCHGRAPDPAELSEWSERVAIGDDAAAAICPPADPGLRDAIAASYLSCLGRKARAEEIDAWIATNQSAEQIGAAICASTEARRHTIASAYLGCLGREARPDEIAAWAGTTHSNAEVRRQICHSPEARRQAIRVAYRQCLRRAPSEAEIQGWDATGLSGGEIRWSICNSAEARKYPVVVVSHKEERPPEWFYDIFRNNCHTAANKGVAESPTDTGIVACVPASTGVGPRGKGIGGHTFNYVIKDGNTSYWNWGPPPCECPGTPPASYAPEGCHRTCVERMCLGQFDAGSTKALPVGQLVEVPGPSICAAQTFEADGTVDDCNACCDERADTPWGGPPTDPLDAVRDSYRRDCQSFCTSFFSE